MKFVIIYLSVKQVQMNYSQFDFFKLIEGINYIEKGAGKKKGNFKV